VITYFENMENISAKFQSANRICKSQTRK